MEQLIIQVGDRFGRSAELARSQGDSLTIGRAYDNDVVLTDPYVDPQQIAFLRSPDGWKVRTVGKTNPALVNGVVLDDAGVAINSGDRIIIGHTQLRVYSSDHKIEPTRRMLLSNWFGHGQSHWLFAVLMLVLASGITVFSEYQSLSTEVKWKEIFTVSLWLGLIILFWASSWALAGRLLRHQPNFTAQLGFTALLTGLLAAITPLGSYVEYAANSELSGEIALLLITLVLLSALFRINLSFATNLKHYTAIAFAGTLATLLTIHVMQEFYKDEFNYQPEYSTVLKPPFARLSGSRNVEGYLDSLDRFFDEVDDLSRRD